MTPAANPPSSRVSKSIPMRRRDFVLTSASALAAALLSRPLRGEAAPGGELRVGVVGHTGQGNYGHGVDTVWLKIPGARIVGVADADPAGLQAARKRLGEVPGFADYRRLFAELRPDIAALCPRQVHEHLDMIRAAVEGGVKAIYIEKPFVRTAEEADEVVRLCAARGVRLAIAHRNRYHPVLPVIRQLLAAGEIGAVREFRVRGKQDQRGGGLDLWVLGGHGFNLATYFAGRPTRCTATVLVEGRPATRADVREGDEGVGRIVGDEIHARFETEGGVPVFFDSKKGLWDKKEGFGLRIVGERGTVDLLVDEEPLAYVTRDGRRQPVTTAGIGQPEPLRNIREINGGHHGAVLDLLAAVRERREPLCGPEAGRETVEMIQAVFASFAAGGATVDLPLRDRRYPL